MKKISLLVFFSLSTLVSIAQNLCHSVGAIASLTTQADVNKFVIDFPDPIFPYTIFISGNLNLSSLSYLKEIKGCLAISDINSLNGLQNLETIKGSLSFDVCTLSNFDELASLRSIGSLYVAGNHNITKLPHFENTSLVSVEIYDNANLVDYSELSKLERIETTLLFWRTTLSNLDFLTNLKYVYRLSLRSNQNLTQIDVLNNLTSLTYADIRSNSSLSTCSNKRLCVLAITANRLVVSDNASGCISKEEIIGNCGDINMPVNLVRFAANVEGEITNLQWSTSSEVNSKNFEILHSVDTKDWQTIGSVNSYRESSVIRTYSFQHADPVIGNNYYRLKMIDLDGTFAFSSVVSSRQYNSKSVSVSPNPSSDVFKLDGVDIGSVQRIEVVNQVGMVIYDSGKIPSLQIKVSNFPEGLYVVKITNKMGFSSNHKVVVKR
jgi:hypothetical protein